MTRYFKRTVSVVTAVAVFLCALVFAVSNSGRAFAESPVTGTVYNCDALNVRSGPGTEYEKIGTLEPGTKVTITETTTSTSNTIWYKITCSSISSGYVHSDYVRITYTYTTDEEFEAFLTAQGFPESYKPYLRSLHAAHPKWIFNAIHTGLKWSTAVSKESAVGTSLVPSSYSDVWKSYEKGAYDFSSSSHIELDSGGWVAASKEAVAYCLDPRTYLTDDKSIFAMENLSYSPSQTTTGISNILAGTFMGGDYPSGLSDSDTYKTYADAFLAAAKASKVSAYHLASRAKQEQGTKGTSLSLGTVPGYKGYYNFFNIGAYKTSSASAITNGAIYASSGTSYGRPWTTPYKSILGGATVIGENYINNKQNTIYLEKFNVANSSSPYTHQYMTNILAPLSEASLQRAAYSSDMLNSALEFNIPVFTSMPEEASPRPSASGSNNNVLKSLSIDGQSLTPTFDKYTYSYALVVANSVSSVTISATPYDSKATVSGAGKKTLSVGTTTYSVKCTAQTGTVRTYKIAITRSEGSSVEPKTTSFTTSKYTVGTYITGVAPSTTGNDFIKNFTVTNGTAAVFGDDDKKITTGIVGTGSTLQVYDESGKVVFSYDVVIYGDTNGSGTITTVDLLLGQNHILGKNTLKDAYLKAADMNKDTKVTTVDLLLGQQHVLGLKTLTQ